MTIFILGVTAATVVKNGDRLISFRNPNIATFKNAENITDAIGTNRAQFNYTPFIGLSSAYQNEKFDENLFFSHFELRAFQITNESNLIPVIRSIELES